MRRTPPEEIPKISKVDGQEPEREMSRLRRFVIGTIVLSLSLLLSFAILEFGLAAFYYSNVNEIEKNVFDNELGWRLKPGKYTIKAPHTFLKHTVFINEMGLRHRDFKPKPDEGTKRIVVLGDSMTFGEIVADEALFSTQLEKKLNYGSSGIKYEVVNAGVPGYGTAQELLLLRRLAKAGIVGNIYLLNIFTNDILDNLCLNYGDLSPNLIQPCFVLKADGQLVFEYKPQNTLVEGGNFVAPRRYSGPKLFSIIKDNLESLAQTKPGLVKFAETLGFNIRMPRMPGIVNEWYSDEVLETGVPLMKALIGEIDTTVKSLDGKLLVVLIPSPVQVYIETYAPILRATFPTNPKVMEFLDDPTRGQRIVRQMCDELGLPFLDMLPVLAKKKNQSFYVPKDGHLNEAGHAAFAASLEQFVRAHVPPN